MPSPDLQRDFSLHHSLSLYLIDTLAALDPVAEAYPLDVLALVEAILENPRAILLAQLDREKGALVDALKSEGVEYEERMEQLDKLEWPKPNRDFIYATFNEFATKHPWVGEDNIAPKGIAREIIERNCSFNELVRDLGVARSEGVLLRYLSDAFRTLERTVPSRHRTPPLEELSLSLGATVRTVDASLLEEWQGMRDPTRATPDVTEDAAAPMPPTLTALATNPRALAARVRAELHRLVGALARKDWEEALEAIWQPEGAAESWTPDRLSAALAPYFAEHAAISVTPEARRPTNTSLEAIGDLTWQATQRLIDPEGDEDWAVVALVDLTPEARTGIPDDTPLVQLLRVGI